MSGTRIDIDLEHVTSPFTTVPNGVYTLELRDVELTKTKDKGDPMVKAMFSTQSETGENVNIFDYWVLTKDSGKFRLKQMIVAHYGNYNSEWTLEELIGTSVEANVVLDAGDDQYGPSNKIKNILQEI